MVRRRYVGAPRHDEPATDFMPGAMAYLIRHAMMPLLKKALLLRQERATVKSFCAALKEDNIFHAARVATPMLRR